MGIWEKIQLTTNNARKYAEDRPTMQPLMQVTVSAETSLPDCRPMIMKIVQRLLRSVARVASGLAWSRPCLADGNWEQAGRLPLR